MFILTLSCFQEAIRCTSAAGIAFQVPCVCLVETFSCFQTVFIGSDQFSWPEFITPMLSVLMKLILYTVNGGIFACVCEANTCEISWTSHVLRASVTWLGGGSCGHNPLFTGDSGIQGDERQCKNVKYCNYSSRIIAKSLLLFSYAGMCAAFLI